VRLYKPRLFKDIKNVFKLKRLHSDTASTMSAVQKRDGQTKNMQK